MPLIPWSTCNIPAELQLELNRRKKNYGLNYVGNEGWSSNGGDWENYRGPMTSWVRVCSNSEGLKDINKVGFVFYGGTSFENTYGFYKSNGANQQILGYTPSGEPHILENDTSNSYPIHVPKPEIIKVETNIQKELFRRATINWECFSSKQLEYMMPYFLTPGVTIIIEYGWNHFNKESLLDLNDVDTLARYYFQDSYTLYNDHVLRSNGNYEVVMGLVTNYEFSSDGNKIHCMTEVTSHNRLYAGVPLSATVEEKSPQTESDKIFLSIKQICETDFVKNLRAISELDMLDSGANTINNLSLYNLITRGSDNTPMKEEYWKGVFYGRNGNVNRRVKNSVKYKWTGAIDKDFDSGNDSENTWVNMGFIIDLLNRSFTMSPGYTEKNNPGKDKLIGFFEVDIEDSIIGAHPNLISTDGSILLIPNAKSPKYGYGIPGKQIIGDSYNDQYIDTDLRMLTDLSEEDLNDQLYKSNAKLRRVLYQSKYAYRDDLDDIINANRYTSSSDRLNKKFAFPFISDISIPIKNREGFAVYAPYFYGAVKNLYINVNMFVNLMKDESIKTYVDLYKKIFEEINKSAGNFWDLSLVINDNTSNMVIVDNRMLPGGNNKSTPWYFDYMDVNQLMISLGFKPKLTDAQAARVVFADSNNKNNRVRMKDDNDLLDFQPTDRILKKRISQPSTLQIPQDNKSAHLDLLRLLQGIDPYKGKESVQFTVYVDGKSYYRRLVLPDHSLLTLLLDDEDYERNQRYTGIQPITVEVNLQGIGGVRTFMSFLIRNLPSPYSHENVAYRIVDVHHIIQNGNWLTTIKAGIIPLRGYIKEKLGIKKIDSAGGV